ncbi:MAG: rubredoxin-like domain-containing protein [Desulfobacterales bacterium]
MSDTLDQEMALAFARMSKSSALNKLYAAKAKRDGNVLLSKLLYSISRSEKIHARRSLMYIRGKLADPTEYLKHLLHDKYENVTVNYPKISQLSFDSGKKKASEAFDQFSEVTKIHLKLLNEALKKSDDESTTYYVCQICGYIAVDEIPPKCPVCNAVQEKFRLED